MNAMRAPEEDESQPVDGAPSERNPLWWVALIGALAFLVGSVGYLVGVRTTEPSATFNEVDIGFLQDMIDHHDQAVQMALLELANGEDPTARHFAEEVLLFQRWEIGVMDRLLEEANATRGGVPRNVMAWMGATVPLADMPGLASEAEMQALADAEGAEADRLFLELMRVHHEGGIHMAEYAAENGSNERVRELAGRIAEYQRIEVREYTMLMERLGYV
jgi:uncharacterized protein (DUF305 family)